MSRLYHSASSDATGRRCARMWFYEYVQKRREPRVEWADIAGFVADRNADARGIYWWRDPSDPNRAVTSRQRSTALGVAVHARIESWYACESVDWHDVPGQIALSGLHFLPDPIRSEVRVETPIGNAAIVGEVEDHAPPVGFRVAGVLWAGFRDLIATPSAAEWARLALPGRPGVALFDHKSSKDIRRYALRSDRMLMRLPDGTEVLEGSLRTDFQANLYALATMVEHQIDYLPARWVYYETNRRRYAEPRDTLINREDATAIVLAGCERARALDTIRDERDAEPNPEACAQYGGCPHHQSVGGPCDARRPLDVLIPPRALVKGTEKMALPPGIQRLAAPPAPVAPAQPVAAAPPPAPVFDAPAAPPPPVFANESAPAPLAEASAPVAPPPAAPLPPAPEPAKRSRTRAAAPAETPAPAPATHAAPAPFAGDMHDEIEIQGSYGPIVIRGHAKDVIAAFRILARGGS